ncbi:YlbF family regulator [Acholeplasma sp. OttesenSCG-928-E16]|nr:YlbF family regulator [Acholeplasma sp. OttesenSCG-928-E16]
MKRTERDLLFQMLRENKAIIEYKKLEETIKKNTRVSLLLEEIHDLQKKLVIKESIPEKERYEAILQEINENPEITHYLDLQSDINLFLQAITKEIEDIVNC